MSFSTILLFQIIFYLMRIIICDDNQTVSNIINLNNEPSNFYKWMEQNSHICAIQEQDEDTPFFLKEIDSIKFDCATICGNPLDIPHMACGKRQSQLENEWPKCFSVPPLCMLNFVQETMALKISLGIFRIEHLIAAVNQKNNLKIKKINLIEKIFPVGQLLVDSETTNKIQKTIKIEEEKLIPSELKISENINEIKIDKNNELKEINCLIMDKEIESCKFWADKGECTKNPLYMHKECMWACGLCRRKEKFKFRKKK